ncbi:hypothetical protein G6O69_12800 [Pseudenhygromyxa sp. WMMC2535]|uniref:hypothetical protein n=1 Tax=Pseudenhygromyxa sp. WMMC2535 TaxID=2712867 RepID=UPI00159585F3|nr:hypothetical protein [Pseudenhygromyxa sp. WMMC2535]NVB38713.1 hypothetical protein [Pseudenhygromyxa sp. WMMC2535]
MSPAALTLAALLAGSGPGESSQGEAALQARAAAASAKTDATEPEPEPEPEVSSSSRAQARPSLVVHLHPCLDGRVALETLHESLRHELGAGLEFRGAAAGQAGDTQLLIDCGSGGGSKGDDSLLLRVIDPLSEAALTRALRLEALDASPERAAESLARSAAALLRALWMDLVLDREAVSDSSPRSPASSPRVLRRARRIARRPSSPWQLGDAFMARTFLGEGAPAWMLGEQVQAVHRPLRHLAWRADGELAFRRVRVDLESGASRINTLMISAAPSLLGWAEFPGSGPRGAGTAAIYAGAGLRVGAVRMRSPDDPGHFETFAGPLATARASVSLGRFVRLALDAEAGWALIGPEHAEADLRLRGPWLSGALSLVSSF